MTKNVILAGVGGQGLLSIAAVLGEAARSEGRLTFEVSTTKNNSRHFVFDAQLQSVRPTESGPGRASRPRPSRPGTEKAGSRQKAAPGSSRGIEETKTTDGGAIRLKKGTTLPAGGKARSRDRER